MASITQAARRTFDLRLIARRVALSVERREKSPPMLATTLAFVREGTPEQRAMAFHHLMDYAKAMNTPVGDRLWAEIGDLLKQHNASDGAFRHYRDEAPLAGMRIWAANVLLARLKKAPEPVAAPEQVVEVQASVAQKRDRKPSKSAARPLSVPKKPTKMKLGDWQQQAAQA